MSVVSSDRRALAAVVFLASIFITLAFWVALPAAWRANESSDFDSFYEPVAHAILEGRGLMRENGEPALRYPPGYPVIVAGIIGTARATRLPEPIVMFAFKALCFGLSSVLVWSLAELVWGPRGALVSATLWMTYPFALWLTKQPNSELPFIVVLFGGLLVFGRALRSDARWPLYFVVGLLLGAAMLIRPIAIGLGLVLTFALFVAKRRVPVGVRTFAALALLLGNSVAILPWELWAYSKTQTVIPLSSGGVPSVLDGLTFGVKTRGYREGTPIPADVRELMSAIDRKHESLISMRAIASTLKDQWRERPLAVAKLAGIKAIRSWYGTDSQRLEGPTALIQFAYFSLLVWGTWSAVHAGGALRSAAAGVWLIVFYFWGMNVASLTLLRYQVPAIGLLFLLTPSLVMKRSG